MKIKFRRDTSFRKQFFVPDSFAHPAKMDAQLLIWIVSKYTASGETILDPMAGSGTTMLACGLGRNAILVELEEKFCKMMRDNWEEVRMRPQLGYSMGTCQIIRGDARRLEGLVDKIVTSPPYAEITHHSDNAETQERFRPGRIGTCVGTAGSSEGQIGQLPYGQIDKIVTSPPYERGLDACGAKSAEGAISIGDIKAVCKELGIKHASENMPAFRKRMIERKRRYVDSIITSPPYEGSVSASTGGERDQSSARQREARLRGKGYDPAKYQGGVGRNLEVDFQYSTRHYRKLPSQSFWRVIYHQKHPEVEQILYEDVLVFSK